MTETTEEQETEEQGREEGPGDMGVMINLLGDIPIQQMRFFRKAMYEKGFVGPITNCEGIQVASLKPLPSAAYRPELEVIDGRYRARYCAVEAFGDTPASAMAAFDQAWHDPAEVRDAPSPDILDTDTIEDRYPLGAIREAQIQELATRYSIIDCKLVVDRFEKGIVAYVTLSEKLALALEGDAVRMFSQSTESYPSDISVLAPPQEQTEAILARHKGAALDLCRNLSAFLDSIRPFA